MLRPLLAFTALACVGASNEFGKKFLAQKREEPDVTALPSGLLYKVLQEGSGDAHPLKDTQCKCHYEGRTAQEYSKTPMGKKFDSSYDRGDPTSFAPSGVIAGWTEAMQLMVEGDKWEMYIPSELGYGDSGQGGDIGAGDVLVFTMEIIKIEGETKPAERGPLPYVDFTNDAGAFESATSKPAVMAVLRQPVEKAKLFQAFKGMARKLLNTGIAKAEDFGLTAASKYDGKTYTTDPLAAKHKWSAPAIYNDAEGGYEKCFTGRPSQTTLKDLEDAIIGCAGKAIASRAYAEKQRKRKAKGEL